MSTLFTLDVRRARHGDCLLLHFGTTAAPGLIVIDGGPRGVYPSFLKPRLEQIRAARELGAQPLPIDAIMVSHVDDDHIQGILDLTKELIEADQDHKPPLVIVQGLWHNSFDAIIGNHADALTSAFKQVVTASTEGELPRDATLDDAAFAGAGVARPDEHTITDTLKVLASVEQGYRLRSDAERLDIAINPPFAGKLIVGGSDAHAVRIGALALTAVGPLRPDLVALEKKHDAWLQTLKAEGRTPEQALAAYVDTSVPNLSSIVVLVECEGKRVLLTGDARGDRILAGLEAAGLMSAGGALHVDVLKVPHHGSSNNVESGFFARITADHYVFSGDGDYGNPERATLEMLFAARGSAMSGLHFTYEIAEIDANRKLDWEQAQQAERKAHARKPATLVRPDWSNATQSLAAFFAAHPELGAKVLTVQPNTPHLIDLLDPLPF